MDQTLLQIFNEVMENGSKEDQEILSRLLKGLKYKQEVTNKSYLDSLLHMNRKMDKDQCEITVPINSLIYNSLNIVHGGITATLLDTTMGSLANGILPVDKAAVTSQINIHYTAVGKGSQLRCIANITHQGKQTMVVEGKVFRDDGTLISFATGTFFVIDRPTLKGN